jgi:uncharacterized membrane protein YhaH (DUF805 family)/glutaredoxin
MEGPVRIVFFGEILPGHEPERVKADLSALLKVTRDEIESVFSGKRVVLRKDLPADQAPRYTAYLEKLGVRVTVEPVEPAAAPASPPLALVEDTPPPAVPAEDEMECPKCHERQPKRTLCRACSVDMPRYLAAQQAATDEERAARKAADVEYAPEDTPLLGLSCAGRIGRLSYLVAGLLSSAFMLGLVAVAIRTQSIALPAVAFLIGFYALGLRPMLLRLHDIGYSGWLWLISFVPVANIALTAVLLFVPGSRDDRGYGLPGRGSGVVGVLVSVVLCGFAMAVFMDQVRSAPPALLAALGGAYEAGNDAAGDGSAPGKPAGYQPGANTVVMYSLTTCPYCAQKRRELDAAGIRFTEIFVDENPGAAATLGEKLQRAGVPPQSVGVPILEVNGAMLPNNPSMQEIVRHLRRGTT